MSKAAGKGCVQLEFTGELVEGLRENNQGMRAQGSPG